MGQVLGDAIGAGNEERGRTRLEVELERLKTVFRLGDISESDCFEGGSKQSVWAVSG